MIAAPPRIGPRRVPAVAFAGPTCSAADVARRWPGALCLPPADQGAVHFAVEELRATRILLIDGMFGDRPTVRHREVHWALSRGVEVVGAGSLGALRAAELEPIGMVGLGTVYRLFRATVGIDDAAIAVATAPPELGSYALSVAAVDASATLRAAVRAGVVAREALAALRRLSAAMPYAERDYARLATAARNAAILHAGGARDLERFAAATPARPKRADALAALVRMARTPPRRPASPPFRATHPHIRDLRIGGLDPTPLIAASGGAMLRETGT